MIKLLLLISLAIVIPSVQAQQLGLIQNVDGRKTVSLDGPWQAIIDPYESGFYDYRYQPSANGYFKNAKPKTKSDLIEYDFDKSGTLKVPGDWNTQSDQLFFYEGTVWYKKSFDYLLQPDKRLRSEEHTSELQSLAYLVCRLLLEKKKRNRK